jgi:hypothetical protein
MRTRIGLAAAVLTAGLFLGSNADAKYDCNYKFFGNDIGRKGTDISLRQKRIGDDCITTLTTTSGGKQITYTTDPKSKSALVNDFFKTDENLKKIKIELPKGRFYKFQGEKDKTVLDKGERDFSMYITAIVNRERERIEKRIKEGLELLR